MKSIARLLCLPFVLFFGTYLSAQVEDTLPRVPESAAQERTTVDWTPDTLFFGDVYAGAIVLDSFSVTNTGEHPYLIREVKASCDCTAYKYPKEPVMPGETAIVRVEFDSAGKAGITRPGIVIYDNSIPNSRSILYMEGFVISKKKPQKTSGGN